MPDHFLDKVRAARGNPTALKTLAAEYRKFLAALEDALLPEGAPRNAEVRKGSQSKQFMIQILPHIQKYMRQFPKGHRFDILDVGPGTGHGADLLASLYQTAELGYRARVSTIDISRGHLDYMRFFCRYTTPEVRNIFDVKGTYDVVIASHVIEHVPNWRPFARRLREVSRGIAIICAPYRENPDVMTKGHVNIIDDDFIAGFGKPVELSFVESPAWGQFMTPRYKMFIAVLEGLARPGRHISEMRESALHASTLSP